MSRINKLIILVENELDKKLIVIIDDLDKLTRYEQAEKFFYKNYQLLVQPNCIFIYTFPISLAFNPYFENVRQYFDGDYVLPQPAVMNKDLTSPDETGVNFFKEIAHKRIDEKVKLIEDDALEYAIINTGKLSEFIRLISDSAIGADVSGKDKITKEEIDECLNDLRATYERTLTKEHIKKLIEIHEKKEAQDESPDNLIARELLLSLTAVEYENEKGDRWRDINLVLLPLLNKWKKSLK